MVKRVVLFVVLGVLVAAPSASARRYLGGHEKEQAVFGAFAFGPGNRNGDRFDAGAYIPTRWETQHCLDAFQSTTRFNWAVEYATYYADTHRACQRVQNNGVAVLKIERWTFSDGTAGEYWTPVTEFDERPCHAGTGLVGPPSRGEWSMTSLVSTAPTVGTPSVGPCRTSVSSCRRSCEPCFCAGVGATLKLGVGPTSVRPITASVRAPV